MSSTGSSTAWRARFTLSATTPLALAAQLVGWRGAFAGMGAAVLLVSALVALLVRDRPAGQAISGRHEAMAAIYDRVDLVLCATNPNVAYPADVTLNMELGGGGSSVMGIDVGAAANNGALTIPANIVGNPSCSVPVGTYDGLPVGMQIMGRHHSDALLLDLARVLERERPWPLVAPGAPV